MIDKSKSVNCANVWWILGADNLTFDGVLVISDKNTLQTDFEGEKLARILGENI